VEESVLLVSFTVTAMFLPINPFFIQCFVEIFASICQTLFCSVPPITVISPLQFILNVYKLGLYLYAHGRSKGKIIQVNRAWFPNQKVTCNDSSGLRTRVLLVRVLLHCLFDPMG
jgi:hypothetical protein